jgi:hypothetical protein
MELLFFSIAALSLTALGLLALAAAIIYLWLDRRALEQAWSKLSERSGLAYQAGGLLKRPSLQGLYRNRQVALDVHVHSTRRSPKSGNFPDTRLRITLHKPSRARLIIQERHRLPSFLQATTPSRDPAVDLKFSIISDPPDLAVKLFNSSSLRERILATHSFNLEITGQSLTFESRGIEKDVDDLLRRLELLNDIADLVEAVPPSAFPEK